MMIYGNESTPLLKQCMFVRPVQYLKVYYVKKYFKKPKYGFFNLKKKKSSLV